jgi:hypothetical protein
MRAPCTMRRSPGQDMGRGLARQLVDSPRLSNPGTRLLQDGLHSGIFISRVVNSMFSAGK